MFFCRGHMRGWNRWNGEQILEPLVFPVPCVPPPAYEGPKKIVSHPLLTYKKYVERLDSLLPAFEDQWRKYIETLRSFGVGKTLLTRLLAVFSRFQHAEAV